MPLEYVDAVITSISEVVSRPVFKEDCIVLGGFDVDTDPAVLESQVSPPLLLI
jgi:hypothetical protein